MTLRVAILTTSLILGIVTATPAIRADVDSALGIRINSVEQQVLTLEKLPDEVNDLKVDVAVLKEDMGEMKWLLRGLFLLVAGVVVERVAQARKSKNPAI